LLCGVTFLARALARAKTPQRIAAAVVVPASLWAAQKAALPPQGFTERSSEEALGRLLRKHDREEPVVLATPDYGYLAVQAAAGSPERFIVENRNDPRDPAPDGSPQGRALELLRARDAHWLVAPIDWREPELQLAAGHGRLGLFHRP
jgi:hypothetical protein